MNLYLKSIEISTDSVPNELVRQDYRTAEVFKAYGIEYCCGMKMPLHMVCQEKGLDTHRLLTDLNNSCRVINLSTSLAFEKWGTDFLIDYILHVHHSYLQQTFPLVDQLLGDFLVEHQNRYPYFKQVHDRFKSFMEDMLRHMQYEETTVFPYLRQVTHAYEEKDSASYVQLLIRTLRKPLVTNIRQDHALLSEALQLFRTSTDHYTPPAKSCPSHTVLLSKMRELDNDLTQHFYLENEILLPRVIEIEKFAIGNGQ